MFNIRKVNDGYALCFGVSMIHSFVTYQKYWISINDLWAFKIQLSSDFI